VIETTETADPRARFVLTFEPFSCLPGWIREGYLEGRIRLLPFPGSLVLWGSPKILRLQRELPLASQIPLQVIARRRAGFTGIRVPQSGWFHQPSPTHREPDIQRELLRLTFTRSHRMDRLQRYVDELEHLTRSDHVVRVLFGADPDAIGLYDKPMARNCQIWTEGYDLLLDGPRATPREIGCAAQTVSGGGSSATGSSTPPCEWVFTRCTGTGPSWRGRMPQPGQSTQ
jgi:hypothetical protein